MPKAAMNRQSQRDGATNLEERAELLRGLMSELCLAAVTFVSQAKLEETARHWLTDSRIKDDEERGAAAVGEALALALDVALFSPSASGTTAIDRFARQHRPTGADERTALAALQRATFRILRLEASDPQGAMVSSTSPRAIACGCSIPACQAAARGWLLQPGSPPLTATWW